MLRFLFLAIFLLAIDWYAFQAVQLLLEGVDASLANTLVVAYWAIPVLTLTWVYSLMQGLTDRWPATAKVE